MLPMSQTHGEDVHSTRQEVLHLRQELESTFRKTLKDLGGTYRRKVQSKRSFRNLAEKRLERECYYS